MEITFSSYLLSIHSFNYFWLRLWVVLSGGGLWSRCAAQEELSSARELQKDPVFSDLSSWQTLTTEMVRVSGSLLNWDPWSRMLLCWAAVIQYPAVILLHPGSHCAPPLPWDMLVLLWLFTLSHSLTCRKQLSLFVGLGGWNGPEMTETWEGEAKAKRSMGRFLIWHKPPLTCHQRQCGWNYLGYPKATVLLFHSALLSVLLSLSSLWHQICSSASSLFHSMQASSIQQNVVPNFWFITIGKISHGLYFFWRLMFYFTFLCWDLLGLFVTFKPFRSSHF